MPIENDNPKDPKEMTFKQALNRVLDNLPDSITREEHDIVVFYLKQMLRMYEEDKL